MSLKISAKVLFITGFLTLAFSLIGVTSVEASHTEYRAPGFGVSGTLNSAHTTLSVTVTSGTAGYEFQNCGQSVPEGQCFNTHTGFHCGPWAGGPRIRDAYVMSGGTVTVGSVSANVASNEPVQTTSGQTSTAQCGEIAGSQFPANFSLSKNVDVSGLSNGTYTLTLTLCTVNGVCSSANQTITINRPTETTLNGSCSGAPDPAVVNEDTVTWTGSASGGNGTYSYSWSGTDGLSGNTKSISKLYSSSESKNATVTITSGSQIITRSCSVTIEDTDSPPSVDSCDIVVKSNLPTSWYIGGDGFLNGISGSGTSATYSPDASHPQEYGDGLGIGWESKSCYSRTVVTPTSQTCGSTNDPVVFEVNYTDNGTCGTPTSAPVCSPSSQSIYAGGTATFSATGGDGLYSWSAPGGNTPSGAGNNFSTSYGTSGTKTVTLTSAGQSATCSVNVSGSEPPFYCTPDVQTVKPGQTASLRACGGTNTVEISWFTAFGTPQRQTSGYLANCRDFNTVFSTSQLHDVFAQRSSFKNEEDLCRVNVMDLDLKVRQAGTSNAYSDGPMSIPNGSGAQLSWTSANATSCTATGGWGGSKATSGTETRSNLTSTQTYTITCSNANGSLTDSVTVNVGSPTNGSQCVGTNVPAQVTAGSIFSAGVTMKNSGTKEWNSDSTPHRLGSTNPNNNTTWGLSRVNLPTSPVVSGTQATFNFSPTAPAARGSYSFDWRMVEETVQWFGETCTAPVQVVASNVNVTSNLATTWTLTGPDGVNNQTASALNVSYSNQTPGSYNISNIPMKDGYKTPTVTVASTQTVADGGSITFNINYSNISACEDGVDNDGDGLVDSNDPGCGDGDDDDEGAGNPPECSDGVDNDGDGKTNFPDDPGCDSNDDNDESNDPAGPGSGGPDFTISSSNNLTIDKDGGEETSNTTTLRVNPLNGFSSDVALSILSGPAVTYNFADTTLSSSEYSSGATLSVTISPDFPRGNYPIVVQGQGGGLTRTRTVILSVNEQGPVFEEF